MIHIIAKTRNCFQNVPTSIPVALMCRSLWQGRKRSAWRCTPMLHCSTDSTEMSSEALKCTVGSSVCGWVGTLAATKQRGLHWQQCSMFLCHRLLCTAVVVCAREKQRTCQRITDEPIHIPLQRILLPYRNYTPSRTNAAIISISLSSEHPVLNLPPKQQHLSNIISTSSSQSKRLASKMTQYRLHSVHKTDA